MIVEQATGHLRWEVDYSPSQPVGAGFEPHWRPQPAKLPSFGGYSLETLPYLCPCMQLCSLRLQFADLFHDLPLHTKLLSIRLKLYISPKLVLRMSAILPRNKLMIHIVLSELVDVFCMAGVHQQPEESN